MIIDLIRRFSRQIIAVWRQRVGIDLLPLLTTVRLSGLILAAIALWGFAEIAEHVARDQTQAFDISVLYAIHRLQRPWLTPIMIFITDIGAPSVLVVASVLVSIRLIMRRHKNEAMTLAIAGFGALALNTLLKSLFERARPALWARVVDVSLSSFPSGHAMLSIVVYGFFGYSLAVRYPKKRGWIFAFTTLLIGLIGFSRLYFGVHWLTDVIAGYAAGLVWLISCIISLEIWRHRHDLKRTNIRD